jgi:hypothetical protein
MQHPTLHTHTCTWTCQPSNQAAYLSLSLLWPTLLVVAVVLVEAALPVACMTGTRVPATTGHTPADQGSFLTPCRNLTYSCRILTLVLWRASTYPMAKQQTISMDCKSAHQHYTSHSYPTLHCGYTGKGMLSDTDPKVMGTAGLSARADQAVQPTPHTWRYMRSAALTPVSRRDTAADSPE